jgi:simple sugar transport system ATP-binding protein
MVGRDVTLGGRPDAPQAVDTNHGLVVRNLIVGSGAVPVVNNISFDVGLGEVVGIAGVEGNGQTELIETIAGLQRAASGSIKLANREFADLTVEERFASGLAHIPEDRHRRGLILDYTIADNLILGLQDHFTGRAGTIDRARVLSSARERIGAFDIRPPDPALAARGLSGGNQQKIVIARELSRDYKLLLAAQPTRGVDVGASEFIHAQIRAARRAGRAVLLVSADLQEILALSDRILVMYRGKLVTNLPRAEANEEVLGAFMTGAAA